MITHLRLGAIWIAVLVVIVACAQAPAQESSGGETAAGDGASAADPGEAATTPPDDDAEVTDGAPERTAPSDAAQRDDGVGDRQENAEGDEADEGDDAPADEGDDGDDASTDEDTADEADEDTDRSGITATRPERRELAEPIQVRIPAIDVDEDLTPVGYNDDRTMEVPDFGDTAWFDGQPKPGQRGASVITGHVDTRDGPDVFFRLGDLTSGDEVEVDLADGSTVTYVVTGVEEYAKDSFPHELIYGHTSSDTLRLITCDGLFDQAEGSYEDNLIVFAEVVEHTT